MAPRALLSRNSLAGLIVLVASGIVFFSIWRQAQFEQPAIRSGTRFRLQLGKGATIGQSRKHRLARRKFGKGRERALAGNSVMEIVISPVTATPTITLSAPNCAWRRRESSHFRFRSKGANLLCSDAAERGTHVQ